MRRDEVILLAKRIAAITGPLMKPRVADHLGTDRVQLHVPMADEKIPLGLDRARAESPLPERAGAFVQVVEVRDVTPPHALHRLGERVRGVPRRQEMDVVGHEHVGVNGHPGSTRHIDKAAMEVHAVALGAEYRLAVVPPYPDVGGNTRNVKAAKSGHDLVNAEWPARSTKWVNKLNWSLTPIIFLL